MTTTVTSLAFPAEIVDEYVRMGLSSIFLRPLSPYGFAVKTGLVRKYDTDDWLDFYRAALGNIIALNLRGVPFREEYSSLILALPHSRYCWRIPHAAFSVVINRVKADVLVTSRGRSANQSVMRDTLIAVAVATCCRCTFASPT
jgi:hypothetical protein